MPISFRLLGALACMIVIGSSAIMLTGPLRATPSKAADVDLARTKPSAAGLYTVSMEPERGVVPQGDLHAWVVTLRSGDAPVDGATITVDGGMPEHQHGLPTSPAMTGPLGEGRYRIDGFRFNMAGWWEIRLAIDGPAGPDEVVFNIVL